MAEKVIREPFELYGGKVKGEYLPKSHRYYILEKNGKVLEKKYMPSSVTSISGQIDKSRVLMGWAVGAYTQKVKELMGDGVNFTKDDLMSILAVSEKAYTERSDEAKGIGDYVHRYCELYSQDDQVKIDKVFEELGEPTDDVKEIVMDAIKNFPKWVKDNNVKFIKAEQIAYSLKHDFIGRFDAILEINGKKYVADYKTSNGIYNEHYYQASAYLKALEEETGEKFDGAVIVAIAKQDKEDKNGEIIKRAGDITTKIRSRIDLIKDFKAFKGLVDLKVREKQLQAEYRANNK